MVDPIDHGPVGTVGGPVPTMVPYFGLSNVTVVDFSQGKMDSGVVGVVPTVGATRGTIVWSVFPYIPAAR